MRKCYLSRDPNDPKSPVQMIIARRLRKVSQCPELLKNLVSETLLSKITISFSIHNPSIKFVNELQPRNTDLSDQTPFAGVTK